MPTMPDTTLPPPLARRLAASLPRPTRSDWVFALRTLLAAFLAFAIARISGLGHPPWAIVTVFVVAQPVAGMVLAKSAFRVLGTCVGATAGVVIATTLGAQLLAFAVAIALWIGACTFTASSLRNPEAYGAALSGYTATIVALPAMGHPQLVRALAEARVSEILVGIACAALTSRLILPQLASDALAARLRRAIVDLATYATDAFTPTDAAQRQADFHRLVTDVQALSDMRTYVRLELPGRSRTGSVRHAIGSLLWTLSAVRLVHRIAAPDLPLLHPVRAGLADTLATLARDPQSLDDPAALCARFQSVIDRAAEARAHVRETPDPARTLARLAIGAEVARAFQALVRGHAALASPEPRVSQGRRQPTLVIHRDARTALRNALRASLATLLFTGVWLASGHPELAGVIILVAVGTSLYPSAPDPLAAIRSFLKGAAAALPLAFLAGQILLPHLPSLAWLPLVTVPVLLPAALAMANPGTASLATAFAICFLAFLNPEPGAAYDPRAFLIASVSVIAGLSIALGIFTIILPPHPQARLAALARAMRETLLRLAIHDRVPSRSAFESLAYDRVNAMIRPAQSLGAAGTATLAGALGSVTFGLQLLALRRLRTRADAATAATIGAALHTIALEILSPGTGRPLAAAVDRLRTTAADLAATPSPDALEAAAALRIIAAATEAYAGFFRPEEAGAPKP